MGGYYHKCNTSSLSTTRLEGKPVAVIKATTRKLSTEVYSVVSNKKESLSASRKCDAGEKPYKADGEAKTKNLTIHPALIVDLNQPVSKYLYCNDFWGAKKN